MNFKYQVVALLGLIAAGCDGSGSLPAPVNQAPTISTIPDQSTEANQQSAPIAFTVADEQVSSLAVTAMSDNQHVVPDAALELGGAGTSRTLRATPELDMLGDAFITIFATDAQGLTASESFLLTIDPQQASMQQFTRTSFALAEDGEPGLINALQFDQDADNDDFADLLAQ